MGVWKYRFVHSETRRCALQRGSSSQLHVLTASHLTKIPRAGFDTEEERRRLLLPEIETRYLCHLISGLSTMLAELHWLGAMCGK
jgi:hypothetical protein